MNSIIQSIILTMGIACSITAAEVNLNNWTDEYKEIATGGKDDVQYNVYRNGLDVSSVYVELINRKNVDVKVDARLVSKYKESEKTIPLTGFIQSKGFWPNGFDKKVVCNFKELDIEIKNVTVGVVEVEQVIEMDSDGKQIEKYKYKFKTLEEAKKKDSGK